MAETVHMNEHCKECILIQISISLDLIFSGTTYLLTDLLFFPYSIIILIGRDHYIFHVSELQLRRDSLTSVE